MNALSERIIRFRYLIIIMVTAITMVMAYFMKDLEVNADVMSYLMEEDASVQLFNQIGETYGGNDMVIVGLEGPDVFTHGMLELVNQVTDSIWEVPGIGYVTSLTSTMDIRSSGSGIVVGPLVDEFNIPEDQKTLDSLRSYILSNPLFSGKLVSEDATATLVIGRILPNVNRVEVMENIEQIMEGIQFEGNVFYGGVPVTLMELNRIIVGDLLRIGPVAFVLICLMLYAGFRNFRGVFLPMLTVVVSAIWTMGLVALLGYKVTLLTNAIPIILLALGNDYAIHVVHAMMVEQRINPVRALQRAVRYIVVPIVLASVTTMLGFFSFVAGSKLLMIREFAMFSIAGILFSLVLTITLVPALIAVMNKKSTVATTPAKPNLFDVIPQKLLSLSYYNRKKLLAFWALIVLISIVGITRISRSVDIIDYFKPGSVVKQGDVVLSEKFYSSNPLYIRFSGDMLSPEVLNLISDTQDYMQEFEYIPYSYSLADLIKQLNHAMGEGMSIPDEREKIAQLWFLLDGQEVMEQLVSYDLQEGIVQGFVTSNEMQVLSEIETNFNAYVRNHSSENCQMAVTGVPVLLKQLDENIVRSQVRSLIIAVLCVILLTSLLIGSARTGLLAAVPVGITLVALFGLMGLAGVPIDMATVLAGSVTIGIGIDFSIHFISRVGEGRKMQLDARESLDRAIRTSGKSIVISMLSIVTGVLMLVFSSLIPLQRLGLLLAFTMLVSGMATLTLLPMVLIKR